MWELFYGLQIVALGFWLWFKAENNYRAERASLFAVVAFMVLAIIFS